MNIEEYNREFYTKVFPMPETKRRPKAKSKPWSSQNHRRNPSGKSSKKPNIDPSNPLRPFGPPA